MNVRQRQILFGRMTPDQAEWVKSLEEDGWQFHKMKARWAVMAHPMSTQLKYVSPQPRTFA